MKPHNESFKCDQCRTLISYTPYGHITECEHHPLEPITVQTNGERSSFSLILAKFAREENPVTKSVYRDILRNRIDIGDIS